MSYDASDEWIRKYATKILLPTTENMPDVDNMFNNEDIQLLAEMNIREDRITTECPITDGRRLGEHLSNERGRDTRYAMRRANEP